MFCTHIYPVFNRNKYSIHNQKIQDLAWEKHILFSLYSLAKLNSTPLWNLILQKSTLQRWNLILPIFPL